MEFDFHSTYANYTNVELLKIVWQKELYQSAAIDAAESILNGRQITDTEREEAKAEIEAPILLKEQRKQKQEELKSELADTAYRFFFPQQKNTVFYIRLFCIVYSILWLIGNISSFRFMLWDLQAGNYLSFILLLIIQGGYVLAFYWLFKLDKKGWVLVMIYFSFTASFAINDLVKPQTSLFPFLQSHNTYSLIYTLVYCGLILYFFNRRNVLIVLKVRRRFYYRVVIACIIFLLLNILRGQVNLSYYLS